VPSVQQFLIDCSGPGFRLPPAACRLPPQARRRVSCSPVDQLTPPGHRVAVTFVSGLLFRLCCALDYAGQANIGGAAEFVDLRSRQPVAVDETDRVEVFDNPCNVCAI
jgi:hypothetical protein